MLRSAAAKPHRSTRPSLGRAVADAFRKLDPRVLVRNPVIFVTEVGRRCSSTVLFVRDLLTGRRAGFSGQIAAWLWFTVLFANFAEAIAEGRGKAQADTLRSDAHRDRAPSGWSIAETTEPLSDRLGLELQAGRYRAGRGR